MARELIKRCRIGRSAIHGWGLFAHVPEEMRAEAWRRGAVLDETPLQIVRDYGELADYVYSLGQGRFGLPKGDGIFANSSDRPNAHWELDLRRREEPLVRIIADRRIRNGEEVTIAYAPP